MRIEGTGAVVTGGASGVGLGIARALGRRGARVILADIEADRAAEAAARLSAEEGAEVSALHLDVLDEASWAEVADLAFARLGAVNLLCNNAGVGAGGTAQATAQRTWDWVLGVNFHGVRRGVEAFAPSMLAQGAPGRIVNTGSEHSLGLPPSDRGGIAAAYTTSKHAVMGYTLCLRRDLEGTALSAAIVCPGVVQSDIWNAFRNRPAALGGPRQAPPAWGEANARGLAADTAGERVVDQIEADAFFIFTNGPDEAQVLGEFATEAAAAMAAFRARYEVRGPSRLAGL